MLSATRRLGLLFLVGILFVAIVSACNQLTTPLESPLTVVSSPLPTPISTPLSDLPIVGIPKPGRDTGVIVARIFSTTLGDYLPGVVIYLGEILPLDPGSEYLITLKEQESLHQEVNEDGYIIFDKVTPGEYAFVVWSPLRSVVVPDPDGELELRIKIEAGQVLNLGELSVQWP